MEAAHSAVMPMLASGTALRKESSVRNLRSAAIKAFLRALENAHSSDASELYSLG